MSEKSTITSTSSAETPLVTPDEVVVGPATSDPSQSATNGGSSGPTIQDAELVEEEPKETEKNPTTEPRVEVPLTPITPYCLPGALAEKLKTLATTSPMREELEARARTALFRGNSETGGTEVAVARDVGIQVFDVDQETGIDDYARHLRTLILEIEETRRKNRQLEDKIR
jgi:hypothetical protein